MTRVSPQRWTARLLAAVASLALVLASLLGSAAHACETSRHGQHRHQDRVAHQATHDHEAPAKAHSGHGSDLAAAAHDTAGPAASDPPESNGPDRKHNCCMDFICHGCIAIIASGGGSQLTPWHAVRVLPWDTQALASVTPARLDRPPKALVSA